jgi:uncharacterized phosphosugar-binding protein
VSGADGYLGRVGAMIERLQDEQLVSIREAGRLVAEVLRADRLVHVFGTGHSHMLAEEGLYRAGGLAPVNAILESGLMLHEGAAVSTRLEKLSGYSPIVADKYGFEEGDLLVVVSNSGVNAAPVEIALLAKEAGLKRARAAGYGRRHLISGECDRQNEGEARVERSRGVSHRGQRCC